MEQNRPTTAPTLSVSSGRKNSYETEEFSTTSIHILSNHREISSLQPIPILRSTGFGLSGSRSVINKRENTRSAPRLAHINYRDMITNKKAIDTTSIIKSPRLLKSLDTPILKSLDHYPLEEKKDVDDVAKVHNVDTPLVNTNKKTVTIAADPIDDYTMEVKDTTEGNLIYDHDLNHLTQKDRDALRLGRMIISCILTSPEISVPDSISRFFIDAWLSRNGSSTMSADAYSLTLMSNLQKSLTQNDVGIDSNPIGAAKSLKSVCAVACEIFDTMIQLFGKQNPILYDLRESFYPCIYMDYPNANNLAEANIEVPYASPSKNHEGLSYHNRKTWCEDTAIIVQKLFETEELYNKEKKEKQAALQENQALQIKLKQVIHEMEISQGNLIKLEKEHQRIKQRNRDLVSKNEGLEKTCAELTIKSKKDADTISKQQSTISSLRLQIDDLNYRLQQEMTKSDHLQSHLEEKEATLRQFKEENSTLLEKVDSLSKQLAATITREEDYKAKWTLLKQTESNNMKKFQETLQLDSFAAGLLSHNMHALFHHKEPKVFDLLMQWGKDLLKLVKELKHKCSDESLEELVNLKFKEVCERNAEAIKEVQDREDELIRSHKMAMHKLEVDMQKIRIELLDNQMEVKTLEEEKKNMKSSYQELNTRFLSRQKDWEMKFEKTNTTKSTFQDRIGMLFEDTRFEERFRDKTRENVVLKARIAEMLPELQKVVSLKKQVSSLQGELTTQQNKITSILSQSESFMHSPSLPDPEDMHDNSKMHYERLCMDYESTIGYLWRNLEVLMPFQDDRGWYGQEDEEEAAVPVNVNSLAEDSIAGIPLIVEESNQNEIQQTQQETPIEEDKETENEKAAVPTTEIKPDDSIITVAASIDLPVENEIIVERSSPRNEEEQPTPLIQVHQVQQQHPALKSHSNSKVLTSSKSMQIPKKVPRSYSRTTSNAAPNFIPMIKSIEECMDMAQNEIESLKAELYRLRSYHDQQLENLRRFGSNDSRLTSNMDQNMSEKVDDDDMYNLSNLESFHDQDKEEEDMNVDDEIELLAPEDDVFTTSISIDDSFLDDEKDTIQQATNDADANAAIDQISDQTNVVPNAKTISKEASKSKSLKKETANKLNEKSVTKQGKIKEQGSPKKPIKDSPKKPLAKLPAPTSTNARVAHESNQIVKMNVGTQTRLIGEYITDLEADSRTLENNFLSSVFSAGQDEVGSYSSTKQFFERLESREKMFLKENGKMRIQIRELQGVYDKVKEILMLADDELLHSEAYSMLNELPKLISSARDILNDSAWIFQIRAEKTRMPEIFWRQQDPIVVAGSARMIESIKDDVEDITKTIAGASLRTQSGLHEIIKSLAEANVELKKIIDEKGGWHSLLHRSDGTIDRNISMFGWNDSDQLAMYRIIFPAIQKAMEENEQRFYSELSQLKKILENKETEIAVLQSILNQGRTNDTAIHEIEQLKHLNNVLLDQISKATMLMSSLTHPIHGGLTLNSYMEGGDHVTVPYEESNSFVGGRVIRTTQDPLLFTDDTNYLENEPNNNSSLVNNNRRPSSTTNQRGTLTASKSVSLSGGEFYGNAGLLWKKLEARRRAEKSLQILEKKTQGWKRALDVKTVEIKTNANVQQNKYAEVTTFQLPNEAFVNRELDDFNKSLDCLVNTVLYSNQLSASYVEPLVAEDDINVNSQSEDILSCIMTLNEKRNHLLQEMNKIETEKKRLINPPTDAMELEAERYFANSLRKGFAPSNVANWSKRYLNGSGSDLVKNLEKKSIDKVGGEYHVKPFASLPEYRPKSPNGYVNDHVRVMEPRKVGLNHK